MALQGGLTTFQAFGEQDYSLFSTKVHAKFGIRLSDYKADQMKRRLAATAQRDGCRSFVEYFGKMERDTVKLTHFLDEMTINVTELLRNPNLFDVLIKDVMPGRFPSKSGEFRVWSAGCSYGAEAYTLAMLLSELSPSARFSVRGTDIDLTILARANTAHFSKVDMVNISEERRKRYFVSPDGNLFIPLNTLRERVTFNPHDLLADPYPVGQYDLILCRNVLIYFNDEAKERIYRGFSQSLKPGGILFVGGTERLSDHAKAGFSLLRPFFYEKQEGVLKKAA